MGGDWLAFADDSLSLILREVSHGGVDMCISQLLQQNKPCPPVVGQDTKHLLFLYASVGWLGGVLL